MSEFYLRSRHGNTGSNLMFHNKNGRGYGTDLDKLHLFTLEEAQKELNHDIANLPLLKSEVDKVSIRAVDHQYLKVELNAPDPNNQYVIQIGRNWNGNDIAFVTPKGMTFNYDEATLMTLERAKLVAAAGGEIWSKAYLDTLCRRTFQEENINTRKMITGAGLIYKKPRKRRPATGKTRLNCESCGKIVWDYNLYEAVQCPSCEY